MVTKVINIQNACNWQLQASKSVIVTTREEDMVVKHWGPHWGTLSHNKTGDTLMLSTCKEASRGFVDVETTSNLDGTAVGSSVGHM